MIDVPQEWVEKGAEALWMSTEENRNKESWKFPARVVLEAVLPDLATRAAASAVERDALAERLRNFIVEARIAIQAATTISERMGRTGRVEGLHLANHDRLVREADALIVSGVLTAVDDTAAYRRGFEAARERIAVALEARRRRGARGLITRDYAARIARSVPADDNGEGASDA